MATPTKSISSHSVDLLAKIQQQFDDQHVSTDKQQELASLIKQLQERNAELQGKIESFKAKTEGSCLTSQCAVQTFRVIIIAAIIVQIVTSILALRTRQDLETVVEAAIWLGVANSTLTKTGDELRRQQLDKLHEIASNQALEEQARHEQMLVLLAFLQSYKEYEKEKNPDKFKEVLATRSKLSAGEADHVIPPLERLASRMILSDPDHPLHQNVTEIYATTIPEVDEEDEKEGQEAIAPLLATSSRQRKPSGIRSSVINVIGAPPSSLRTGSFSGGPSTLSRSSIAQPSRGSVFTVSTVFTVTIQKKRSELIQDWDPNWRAVEKYMASLGIRIPCLNVQGVSLTRSSLSMGSMGASPVPRLLPPPSEESAGEEARLKEAEEGAKQKAVEPSGTTTPLAEPSPLISPPTAVPAESPLLTGSGSPSSGSGAVTDPEAHLKEPSPAPAKKSDMEPEPIIVNITH